MSYWEFIFNLLLHLQLVMFQGIKLTNVNALIFRYPGDILYPGDV